jgi:hypothetical protein
MTSQSLSHAQGGLHRVDTAIQQPLPSREIFGANFGSGKTLAGLLRPTSTTIRSTGTGMVPCRTVLAPAISLPGGRGLFLADR